MRGGDRGFRKNSVGLRALGPGGGNGRTGSPDPQGTFGLSRLVLSASLAATLCRAGGPGRGRAPAPAPRGGDALVVACASPPVSGVGGGRRRPVSVAVLSDRPAPHPREHRSPPGRPSRPEALQYSRLLARPSEGTGRNGGGCLPSTRGRSGLGARLQGPERDFLRGLVLSLLLPETGLPWHQGLSLH